MGIGPEGMDVDSDVVRDDDATEAEVEVVLSRTFRNGGNDCKVPTYVSNNSSNWRIDI